MTSKMVLIHWPAASKVFERSIFHSASNIGSVVILIFSDTKWGCLSPTSVQKNQMQWFSFGFVNKIWFVVLEQWLKTVVYSAFCFILWSCGQDTQTLHSKLSFPLMTKWSFFFSLKLYTTNSAPANYMTWRILLVMLVCYGPDIIVYVKSSSFKPHAVLLCSIKPNYPCNFIVTLFKSDVDNQYMKSEDVHR